jgi:hypoxanthine phosphoribosyltransferase
MNAHLNKLIDEEAIQKRVRELGQAITERYRGQSLTAVCVLKGSFMFFSDLIRNIDLDVNCEFFGISSYQGTQSSGEVRVTLDVNAPIENKNILLVEDIVDTGLTMDYLLTTLKARRPKTLSSVALLHKPAAMKIPLELDYIGFKIENQFVVGYGLDYEGWFRNLPYIAEIQNFN